MIIEIVNEAIAHVARQLFFGGISCVFVFITAGCIFGGRNRLSVASLLVAVAFFIASFK